MSVVLIPNEEDTYRKLRREHQAFQTLRLLTLDVFSGGINDGILGDCLQMLALGGSSENIRQIMLSLEEKDLVRRWTHDGYMMILLKEQGERVALGYDKIDGVARPPLEK